MVHLPVKKGKKGYGKKKTPYLWFLETMRLEREPKKRGGPRKEWNRPCRIPEAG